MIPQGRGFEPAEVDALRRAVEMVDRVRALIDSELLAARLLSKKESEGPAKSMRWKVLSFRTDDDARKHLLQFDSRLGYAPGTHFWAGPEFKRPFLAVRLPSDPVEAKHRMHILLAGAKQTIHERLGVNMVFRSDDRGIPILYGFGTYCSLSFAGKSGEAPAVLGGCDFAALKRLREKAAAGPLPPLDTLFDAPFKDYASHPDELHFPALHFAEFLLHNGESSRSDFFRFLTTYRNRGFGGDGPRALAAFLRAFRGSLGSQAEIEAKFRRYLIERCEELNLRKHEAAAGPEVAVK